ncbi:MAG: type II toxin-antitoxin system death-on-curing family toxin [Dactylosporangium sp.]|nr:type II toxin-antitoxin system death-on-curing family toxin [Dactylosporangium sp.]
MTEASPSKGRVCWGEPVYPTAEKVLEDYADVTGVPPATARYYVRDRNALESALQRPRQAAYYAGADLVVQAAHLLCGLIWNHPFIDGNKRVAHAVAEGFLSANGWMLASSESEEFDLLIDVAAGKLTVAQVAVWIREHLEVCDPESSGDG